MMLKGPASFRGCTSRQRGAALSAGGRLDGRLLRFSHCFAQRGCAAAVVGKARVNTVDVLQGQFLLCANHTAEVNSLICWQAETCSVEAPGAQVTGDTLCPPRMGFASDTTSCGCSPCSGNQTRVHNANRTCMPCPAIPDAGFECGASGMKIPPRFMARAPANLGLWQSGAGPFLWLEGTGWGRCTRALHGAHPRHGTSCITNPATQIPMQGGSTAADGMVPVPECGRLPGQRGAFRSGGSLFVGDMSVGLGSLVGTLHPSILTLTSFAAQRLRKYHPLEQASMGFTNHAERVAGEQMCVMPPAFQCSTSLFPPVSFGY